MPDSIYDDLYPDAAPIDFQVEQARRYLERLIGGQLTPINEHDGDGACHDCRTAKRRLYEYGEVVLCIRCVGQRRYAAVRHAA